MAVPVHPPPAFDPNWYRARMPSLDHVDDAGLEQHFTAHGRAAGQPGSPYALREHLLSLIGEDCDLLEIGPFDRPLKRGRNVRYLDALDTDALRARASERPGRVAERVPDIDYVGGLEDVPDRFDVVLSSHAIEHQPDLVRHLQAVEAVLRPGGVYVLIVPDRRYCFDHFLPDSTVAGVLGAYVERRTRHTLQSVIEHRALTTHNDTLRHWLGDHGTPRFGRVPLALDEYATADGAYIDVHAWYFTPESFASILRRLAKLSLTHLATQVYDTPYGRNEFCAILQNPVKTEA
jgi:SAM-dependent methyltransferase